MTLRRLKPARPPLPALLAAAACLFGAVGWAWDGNWTNATSGSWPVFDTNDSHSEAGNTPRPQTFFIPPAPLADDVDPAEIRDNGHDDYSPYGIIRLTRAIPLAHGQKTLPQGYYLVKIGHRHDGSPNTRLPAAEAAGGDDDNPPRPPYDTLIFKQMGKVVAAVPIDAREPYMVGKTPEELEARKYRQKGDPKPKKPGRKQALIWVESTPEGPKEHLTLRFYYRKMLYTSHLGSV